jgi:protein-S-isoprenylcysteine O-methyltransferase Ste14
VTMFGLILIMVGFLLQRPTLARLVMVPVLLVVHQRLASREEREVQAQFDAARDAYATRVPRFVPRLRRLIGQPATAGGAREDP